MSSIMRSMHRGGRELNLPSLLFIQCQDEEAKADDTRSIVQCNQI